MDATRAPGSRGASLLFGMLWVCGAAAGFRMLNDYKAAPGAQSEAPARWPQGSPIERRPGRAILIMLAHPRCPCSRASIGELAWIMARAGARAEAHVFFVKPEGTPAGWERGGLWRAAAAIPGVSAHLDEGGAAARLFGAETSGQTLLFDGDGRLRFRGGITAGRGHAGRSAGRDAVLAALSGDGAARDVVPVFGCALESGRSHKRG